jgi:hypothetical protein
MTVVIIIIIIIWNLFIFADNEKYIDSIMTGLVHEAIKLMRELNGISILNNKLSFSK